MSKEDITELLKPEPEIEPNKDLEVLDFDLETLILEGKDAVIERQIEFFDVRDQKKKAMKVNVRPMTKKDKTEIQKAISKKDSKNSLDELICLKGALDKDGMPLEMSEIKALPSGVVESIAEQVKYVSGEFVDRFEDKAIDHLFGSS